MTLRFQEICEFAEFLSLEKEWSCLLAESGMESPFLSHEWFRCCLTSYGIGKKPAIVTVRDGERLVGVAPCWYYQEAMRGLPLWRVGFIICPDTPFCDFIVEPSSRQAVMEAYVNCYCGKRTSVADVITFDLWSVTSPNLIEFQSLIESASIAVRREEASRNPYVRLDGGWNRFLASKSQRFRKTYRNVANRIQKLGKVEVRCVRHGDSAEIMRSILAVSSKGWKHQEGLALSNSPDAISFFEQITSVGMRNRWLMVWLLVLDGAPIAMEYDLVHGDVVYALRADFDETFKEHSPGAYLEYEILKSLLESKIAEYNTGPGLNAYKAKLTETAREYVRLHLFGNTARGRWCQASETVLIPIIKRIRELCQGKPGEAVA